MGFFDKIWKGLTAKQKDLPSNEPMVTEQLTRSDKDRNSYFGWLQEGRGKKMAEEVYAAYKLKQEGEPAELKVHLLKMPYANGFALTYHPSLSSKDFQHFFDWLKDRVGNLSYYRAVNAERRIFDKGNYIESKEKYYLKPVIDADSSPFNQRFGNVLIEMVWIDRQPSYLKLVANIYSDRLYTEALPFEGLLHEIFE